MVEISVAKQNKEKRIKRNDSTVTELCCCCFTSVVSNSVRPHRRQPTRLPRPWDSPGKNTGVDCHFLFQCMKVKSEREVTQSCPILSDPMDCSPPGSSIHGIFQARVLEWHAIAFSERKSLNTFIINSKLLMSRGITVMSPNHVSAFAVVRSTSRLYIVTLLI